MFVLLAQKPRRQKKSTSPPPFHNRVIQLGLRRDALLAFKGPAFGENGIEDITGFVKATAVRYGGGGEGGSGTLEGMLLPAEESYPVEDAHVAQRLGI